MFNREIMEANEDMIDAFKSTYEAKSTLRDVLKEYAYDHLIEVYKEREDSMNETERGIVDDLLEKIRKRIGYWDYVNYEEENGPEKSRRYLNEIEECYNMIVLILTK